MPKLKNAAPKYRKHRASGQAVITLNGVDHYLGLHGSKASQIEYDRLIGEWLANGRQLQQRDVSITVTELCIQYMKFAQAYYRKDGRCTKVVPGIKAALKYLRSWYGKEPAVEIGPVRLKALRQRMIEDGLSRRYINDQVDRIRRMYKWAAGEQIIGVEAYRTLTLVEGLRRGRSEARETAKITCVADDIVEATIWHLPEVVGDMVRVQRLTGARPAEITIMRPCDVDRTGDVWIYTPESHKTEHHGRDRKIYLGPKAQEVLIRYLARDSEAYCFRSCDSESKRRAAQAAQRQTPLGYGNRPGTNRKRKPKRHAGERYSTDSYRRAIHRAAVKANVEKWSPNRLRHAAGTEVRKAFGLEGSQIILGHASADVSQIYAERDETKGIEIARKLG